MEKRKQQFKKVFAGTGEAENRLRKEGEELRKEKRTLAKRIRSLPIETIGSISFPNAPDSLEKVLSKIKTPGNEADVVGEGLLSLRLIMCSYNPPIQDVIDAGIVDVLISSLVTHDGKNRSDACWILANIASGDHEQCRTVIPAVPILMQFLAASDSNLQDQACWVIGNLAGDSDEYRFILISNGVMKPILDLLLSCASSTFPKALQIPFEIPTTGAAAWTMTASTAHTAAWALSNLARGSSPASSFFDIGAISPLIFSMSVSADFDLVSEICWIFAFLTAKDDASVEQLLQLGLVKGLLSVARRTNTSVKYLTPIVRCFGNISSGPVEWIDALLSEVDFLPFLAKNIQDANTSKATLKETVWVGRNLLGGTSAQRTLIIQAGFLECATKLLLIDEFDLQREAIFALRNACVDSADLISLDRTILTQLVSLLQVPDADVALACMQIIRATVLPRSPTIDICVELGLFDVLDSLQYASCEEELRVAASKLSDELIEVEDDYTLSPDVQTQSLTHGDNTSLFAFPFIQETEINRGADAEVRKGGMGRGAHLTRPSWLS